ncbi:hypothetical protein ACMV8I_07340 [Ewingella sp. S1.OA.A_B6]
MRELTIQEVEHVSGAGFFRDTSGWLGSHVGEFIGSALGRLIPVPIISSVVSNITGFIGKQIGSFVGNTFGSIVEGFFSGSEKTSA